MQDTTVYTNRRRIIPYAIISLILLVTLGFLATSYTSSFMLILGVVLSYLTKFIFTPLSNLKHKIRIWRITSITVAVLFLLYGYVILSPSLFLRSNVEYLDVNNYKVSIEMKDPTTYKIQEKVIPEMFADWISLPEREISSRNMGILLKEVYIAPLNMSPTGDVNITLANGKVITRKLCGDFCPETTIELIDFPKNSFYAAKNAENIAYFPYVDTETITWSVRYPDKGISFAYVIPPFHHFRSLLTPFVGLSSISQWIVGLLSFVVSLVVSPIVKPVLTSIAQDRFKTYLKRKPQKKKKEKISGNDGKKS